jgi:hypothetical protein
MSFLIVLAAQLTIVTVQTGACHVRLRFACHKRTLLYLRCCRTGVQNVICKGPAYGGANLISSKTGARIILNGLLGTNKNKTME